MSKTKICSKCQKRKYLKEFNKRSRNPDGYRYQCKICEKEYKQNVRLGKSPVKKNKTPTKIITEDQHLLERLKIIEFYARKYMKIKHDNELKKETSKHYPENEDHTMDEWDESSFFEEELDVKELGL